MKRSVLFISLAVILFLIASAVAMVFSPSAPREGTRSSFSVPYTPYVSPNIQKINESSPSSPPFVFSTQTPSGEIITTPQRTAETTIDNNDIRDLFYQLIGGAQTPKNNPFTPFTPEILSINEYSNEFSQNIREETNQTPLQRELHAYGNSVGEAVSALEIQHAAQIQTLDVFFKEGSNKEAVVALAQDYQTLAQTLTDIAAPDSVTAVHSYLIEGYALVGERLLALTEISDSELLDALLLYNKASEQVAEQLIGINAVMSAYEVTFAPSEPGAAFMFSPRGL
tara:strand:+ start:24578 stop:25426 length:849 start_codon:yes stop_codon:yes gene_type:complete